jgi:hypothetical protein
MNLYKLASIFFSLAQQLNLPAKEANVVAALFNANLMPVDDPYSQTFNPNHPVALFINNIVANLIPENDPVTISIIVHPSLKANISVLEKSPNHSKLQSILNTQYNSKINNAITTLIPPESTLFVPLMHF